MIKTLQLGIHRARPAMIELLNDKIVLLELVQTKPAYYHELRSFNAEGCLLEFSKREEIVKKDKNNYYKSFEFEVYEPKELIRITSGRATDRDVRELIEIAYKRPKEFYELLLNLRPPKKDEPLRNKLKPMLEKIVDYDFGHLLNYKVETVHK